MRTLAIQNNSVEYIQGRERHLSRTGQLSQLTKEGAYSNIFVVMTGGAFLTGIAILFGANDFELGLLTAIPFALQGAQILSPFLFADPEVSGRRVSTILAVSRLLWLSTILLLFFSGTWRFYVLLGIVSISGLLTMVSSPAWLSLMADIVPRRIRGRFFSRRNVAVAGSTILGTVIGSIILDWFRGHGSEASGFAIILSMAVLGGLMAWGAMSRITDIPSKIKGDGSHAIDVLAPVKDKVFRKVLAIFAVWNIAIGLSAAFFAPHMLLNLDMSFFLIGLYTSGTALIAVISSRLWGRLIDRFGSKPILNVCAFGISLIPMIWLYPRPGSIWILVPEGIYSGLLWAGFNLAAFTLPIDRSPRINRTVYLSVFAAVTGLAFFAASIIGGIVAESLSEWSVVIAGATFVNYHLLFFCSALARLLAAGIMAVFHEPTEMRLPIVIQLMGYAVLKRMSIGRQLFPFAADASESDNKNNL